MTEMIKLREVEFKWLGADLLLTGCVAGMRSVDFAGAE